MKKSKPVPLANTKCRAVMPAADGAEAVDWNMKTITAMDCAIQVKPNDVLCPGHWSQVDPEVRHGIIAEKHRMIRIGQHKATADYRELVTIALNQVWRKSLVGLYQGLKDSGKLPPEAKAE